MIKLLYQSVKTMMSEPEFQANQARLAKEIIASNEDAEKLINEHIENAYKDAGGIISEHDRMALDAVINYLKEGEKIKLVNGVPVFVNDDGKPLTISQSMEKVKKHMTFKGLFSDSTNNPQANSSKQKHYTREDARKGRANINDIATGKASVENTSGKPDWVPATKRVNLGKILKGE